MMPQVHEIGSITAQDAMSALCGEYLGAGAFRSVYVLASDDTKVVKMESGAASFHNIHEWGVWMDFRDIRAVAKWLAPCRHISSAGAWLIQDRTEPLPKGFRLPKSLPEFLTDTKLGNFGLLGGNLVCHDYGIVRQALETKRRPVEWWG